MFDKDKAKQIGLSYFRASATAVGALYMAGEHDPKKLAMAFIAGGQVCKKIRAYKVKNGPALKKSLPVYIVGFGKPVFKS